MAEDRKEYREKNKDRINAMARKNCEEMSDGYIRKILVMRTNLNAADIPKGLIELKRAHLEAKRLLKAIKEESPGEEQGE